MKTKKKLRFKFTPQSNIHIKGPSLTIKWAFASSLFIFVVFTIFAVITYKSSVNLIVTKERTNLEQTIEEVNHRLANNKAELTTLTTLKSLDLEIVDDVQGNDNSVMNLDSFTAELSQSALTVYVYNPEKKFLFSTKNKPMNLMNTKDVAPKIVGLHDNTGFLMVKEVKSKATGKVIGYIQAFYQLSSFYEIRSHLLIILLVLELVSLLLSSILGFFLASYFLKPLRTLRDTMDTIRKDPQSTLHMKKLNTNDELEDISEIFNEMLDRMRRYIEQQEQFVGDVSHELRTPVAIIEGHLSMLTRWGKDDPEVLDEGLNASLQEVQRMKSLVQEMLDLSRAGFMDNHVANKTTNGREVVQQVYNNFKLLYPQFKIYLDDYLGADREVAMYRNHLEQLIIIILDNAIKYSTDRQEVSLSIEVVGKYFEISIQDFGEGMSEDEVGRIFDRFYRVDKARARTKGGNGLGLSIAKQLVENYKGKIEVESVPDQGTTFHIFIPLASRKETTILR